MQVTRQTNATKRSPSYHAPKKVTVEEAMQAVRNANAYAFFASKPPCREAYSRLLWECEIAELPVDTVVRLVRKNNRNTSNQKKKNRYNKSTDAVPVQNNIFALLQPSSEGV